MEVEQTHKMGSRLYWTEHIFSMRGLDTERKLRILALGLLQGVDGLITALGVNNGLLYELNPLLWNYAGSGWLITLKLLVGVILGLYLCDKNSLYQIVKTILAVIVVFNALGLLAMWIGG